MNMENETEVEETETVEQALEAAPEMGGEPIDAPESTFEASDAVEAEPDLAADPAPAAADMTRFDRLADALGALPDEPNERLLENIDEKTIEKMPVEAKVMLRHLLSDRLREMDRNKAAQAAAQESLKKHKQQLDEDARALVSSRAKMAQVFQNEELQGLLKKGDVAEKDLPDPFTPEGIQARIDRATAQGLQRFIEPITASANRAQAESKYNDFVASHPKMMDTAFKSAVVNLIRDRKTAGVPIPLKDAHDLVEHQRLVRDAKVKRDKERARRAESARKINRASVSSDPDNGSIIPTWVTKKGYKGRRGAAATYLFLKDNPKIHAQIKKTQGRT
tara:strand:+ start:6638 stop:7642 length:1005 start_codon:yes stop_codon:yes gene_type:complete